MEEVEESCLRSQQNLASKCSCCDSSSCQKKIVGPPADFVVPRRLTAVVRVWAEVSLSVVTCKCMRPDPVTVVAAAAATAARARVPGRY